mmetsp:Transcript_17628/g.52206  ORF Transcript_17628/g.52206 Transcript_17628/m.52206 type:complete len:312 (-) Transcript_17628:27-962(-)
MVDGVSSVLPGPRCPERFATASAAGRSASDDARRYTRTFGPSNAVCSRSAASSIDRSPGDVPGRIPSGTETEATTSRPSSSAAVSNWFRRLWPKESAMKRTPTRVHPNATAARANAIAWYRSDAITRLNVGHIALSDSSSPCAENDMTGLSLASATGVMRVACVVAPPSTNPWMSTPSNPLRSGRGVGTQPADAVAAATSRCAASWYSSTNESDVTMYGTTVTPASPAKYIAGSAFIAAHAATKDATALPLKAAPTHPRRTSAGGSVGALVVVLPPICAVARPVKSTATATATTHPDRGGAPIGVPSPQPH